MRKKLVLFLLLVCSSSGVMLSAQELVQFDAANPPFMFVKDREPAGLYPRLFQEAFRRMGLPVVLGTVPWKRALADTDDARAGIGGIYQNTERLKKYDFSSPYYAERLAIYVPAGKVFDFKSVNDLRGKTLNVLKGWSYGDEYDSMVKSGAVKSDDGATSDELNFRKLMDGRNDGVISVVESGEAVIRALNLEGKVVMLPKLLHVNPVYLAFSKRAHKNALLADFDKAIAAMKADGTFERLVASSFGD